MELSYLDFRDLCDTLINGMWYARRNAKVAIDENEREYWDEKEKRYQELKKKLQRYAVDNLY